MLAILCERRKVGASLLNANIFGPDLFCKDSGSLSQLEIIGARRFVSSLARSMTGRLAMRDMTRRLADRRVLWTLDREPRGANLWIAGLSAGCLAASFVTRTT
jgi:hypothetical protein